jgi:uncharacterized membrane protein
MEKRMPQRSLTVAALAAALVATVLALPAAAAIEGSDSPHPCDACVGIILPGE